jgi:hypothetical protein
MKKDNLTIEYKAKGIIENIPSCIVRRIIGDNIFKIEYCNKFQKWKDNPDLISCWMGSFDADGYGSPPDGEDISSEDAESFIELWQKNWQ